MDAPIAEVDFRIPEFVHGNVELARHRSRVLVPLIPQLRCGALGAMLRVLGVSHVHPYRIVGVEPDRMLVESHLGRSSIRFSGYDVRLETSRAFVLADATTALPIIIPKRVFRTSEDLDAFRHAALSSSAGVGAMVHTSSEAPDSESIRFLLTVEEVEEGLRLSGAGERVDGFARGMVLLAIVLVGFVLSRIDGAVAGALFVAFVLSLGLLGSTTSRRRRATILARLRPTSVALDESGFVVETALGSLRVAWSGCRSRVEGPRTFSISLAEDVAVVLPKRALSALDLERMRRMVAQLQH